MRFWNQESIAEYKLKHKQMVIPRDIAEPPRERMKTC